MENVKKRNFSWLTTAALLAAALLCLLLALLTGSRAIPAIRFPLRVTGEYSCDRGATWQPLTQTLQFPTRERELWVRGRLNAPVPEGMRLYYYRDHIGVAVYQNGEEIFQDAAMQCIQTREYASSACGRVYT